MAKSHVVILPSPGMGHFNPFIEFAKHLVQLHDFHVTCIIPTIGSPSDALNAALEALPPAINHIYLPPLSLEEEIETAALMSVAVSRCLPSLRDVLKVLLTTTPTVAFLADLFGTDAFSVAKEFDLSPYLFFASNTMSLSFCFYLPKLDQMVSCEYRDLPEPLKLPGCIPLHGDDLMEPVLNRTSQTYKSFLESTKRFVLAIGVIVNTFMDLERKALKAWQEEPGHPPIYPIGPLVRAGPIDTNDGSESDCLRWLDNQPGGSVLFVSLGSGGTLSHAQSDELALGLEMSKQRFLWVVRIPNDESACASFFSVKSQQNPLDFLPEGFLDRTKEQGLVVPSWAPQAQVLSHGSTGGFVTHCGWNSVLEGIVNGVPLIAWPLYAEQKMNAVMLTEDFKVALRPKSNENGMVMREEIAEVIKQLMEEEEEGKKIRKRVKDLKDAAAMVLMEDGSSRKALSKLANEWKSQSDN